MGLLIPIVTLAANLIILLVLYMLSFKAIGNPQMVANIVSFSQYIMILMFTVVNGGFMMQQIGRAMVSIKRINEVLNVKEDNPYHEENINEVTTMEFDHVSFKYANDSKDTIKDVSFTINKGERIGFVGSSGSGKSTIFKLLTKLYSLNEGKILIDGEDINNISNKSLRKNISLISQSPYIFNFSVLDNLKIGNLDASNDEVKEACKKADIYDVIMDLDDKFNTFVGEGGVMLSGGEKQRLAIARTLLKKSNIILFDEATSALDNVTQDKVQKAIYGLDKDKTILIIAHRLSTVNKCDRIVVVDDGNIVDIGTHKELYKRCSKYRELYDCEIA